MSFELYRALVLAFFEASSAGALPDDLLTDDMTAWTTLQGKMDKKAYQHVVTLMPGMTREPIRFFIDAITCEEDRAVAEVHSEAVLINGSDYRNTYVFAFRFRDSRICHVAEHFNAVTVMKQLVPLMQQA